MGFFDKILDAARMGDEYDEDADEFFDEDFEDDFAPEEKPRKKFFEKFKGGKSSKEEFYAEEEPIPVSERFERRSMKKAPQPQNVSSKITPMRSSRRGTEAPQPEVRVLKPCNIEDARDITDNLRESSAIVLNLEGLDTEVAQRIFDFTCGTCYSFKGSFKRISNYIFLLTPPSVRISGEAENILSDEEPETSPVRSAY